jgi:hypothetical protein
VWAPVFRNVVHTFLRSVVASNWDRVDAGSCSKSQGHTAFAAASVAGSSLFGAIHADRRPPALRKAGFWLSSGSRLPGFAARRLDLSSTTDRPWASAAGSSRSSSKTRELQHRRRRGRSRADRAAVHGDDPGHRLVPSFLPLKAFSRPCSAMASILSLARAVHVVGVGRSSRRQDHETRLAFAPWLRPPFDGTASFVASIASGSGRGIGRGTEARTGSASPRRASYRRAVDHSVGPAADGLDARSPRVCSPTPFKDALAAWPKTFCGDL